MKHKHRDLIIAWADGAPIEKLCVDNRWRPLNGYISWSEDNIYRIEPYPGPVYRQLIDGEIIQEGDQYLDTSCNRWTPYIGMVGHPFYAGAEYQLLARTTRPAPAPAPKPEVEPDVILFCETRMSCNPYIFFTEDTRANLKLTFDGTTDELKSAEVIK